MKARVLKQSAVVLCVPAFALACSGPGAVEAIDRALLIGTAGLVVSFIAFIIGAVKRGRRRWWLTALWAVPLAAHPGLWVSAFRGDCGAQRVQLSVIATVCFVVWSAWSFVGKRTA